MKVICYQCGNPKFVMVRYHLRGKTFCKMSCRNNYVQGRDRTPPKQFECLDKSDQELVHLLQYPPDPKRFDVV